MVHRSLLLLAVALLRLVVAPTLNTRKTPARGARDFYHGLPSPLAQRAPVVQLARLSPIDQPDDSAGQPRTVVRLDAVRREDRVPPALLEKLLLPAPTSICKAISMNSSCGSIVVNPEAGECCSIASWNSR
jgi:hypothetical protein